MNILKLNVIYIVKTVVDSVKACLLDRAGGGQSSFPPHLPQHSPQGLVEPLDQVRVCLWVVDRHHQMFTLQHTTHIHH